MARYLPDHPQTVQNRCVVDLGGGSGILAQAMAADRDPDALSAAAKTARLNGVDVTTCLADIEDFAADAGAAILAGDPWYEREVGRLATRPLRRLADDGRQVICGDPGRPGRPRKRVVERARYCVPATRAFERLTHVECRVFELLASPMPRGHSSHASGAGARRTQRGETGCNVAKRRSRPTMIDDVTRS